MSARYQIVPWYNIDEWHEVYNEIFAPASTLSNKQKGLDHLLIWKARCPTLPSGIESTLTLLEVQLQDVSNNEMYSHNLIRLAYSSAVMRFVNHMVDTETAKGMNLFQAAKTIGIPDWIIELRHDTAHSDRLPSIEELREACLASLEWLRNNYWDKHKECIENFTTKEVMIEHNSDLENKVEAVINFCISLSICSHSGCKIKKVIDIKDASMRDSLENDARELLGNQFIDIKMTSINALFEAMNTKAKKIFNNGQVSHYVNKVLLSEESLLLSLELHELLDPANNEIHHQFSKKYVECFQRLLNFLHRNDLLLNYLLELIKYTHSEDTDRKKGKLAAHWVSVILRAWCRNQQFKERLDKTETRDVILQDKRDLQSLYYHWFPNESKKDLMLDLRKSVPKEITNMTIIQPIISTYNCNLTYFIKDLLQLVRPKLPNAVIIKISNLAKIVASPDKFPIKTSSRIYTTDDVKLCNSKLEDVEIVETEIEDVTSHEKDEQTSFGIWRVAPRNAPWVSYPVGQIPPLGPMETMK